MSAPLKVAAKKSASSIEPIAAFAAMVSISFCRSALLLMIVTECPFAIKSAASGLLICPKEPVKTMFIFIYFFVGTKLQRCQKTAVAESQIVVVKKEKSINFWGGGCVWLFRHYIIFLCGGLFYFFLVSVGRVSACR